MSQPQATSTPADAALADLRARVRMASWFAALGERLTAGERWDARAYLAGLGFADAGVAEVSSWAEAAAIAKSPDWSRAWWDREEAERQRLLKLCGERYAESDLMTALSRIMELASAATHGAAAIAASRAGVADPALIRVAAGAAAQAAYQAALPVLAGAAAGETEHAFAVKFRLFEAGRWPLGIAGGSFHLF
jgi:hypothetical protein